VSDHMEKMGEPFFPCLGMWLPAGLNCAEAVNFAPTEWLAWSRAGVQRSRLFRRKSILSHEELLCVALLVETPRSACLGQRTHSFWPLQLLWG